MQYLLKNLAVPARIGVYEAEKDITQTLILNVSFDFDSSKAEVSDNLSDTIDYAQIEVLLREVCMSEHHELLEKLHAVLMQKITEGFPQVQSLTVSIEKTPFETGSVVIK